MDDVQIAHIAEAVIREIAASGTRPGADVVPPGSSSGRPEEAFRAPLQGDRDRPLSPPWDGQAETPAVPSSGLSSRAKGYPPTPSPVGPLSRSVPPEPVCPAAVPGKAVGLAVDLPDPAAPEFRCKPRVADPVHPEGLQALIASTTARIGVGRSGPRYGTKPLLLFQADHATTQDALFREVDRRLLDELGLFTVQTRITGGKQEYLLRPDLGRRLNEEAGQIVGERCPKGRNIQVVAGDGLSAAAIEANLPKVLPVLEQGARSAGLTFGTPFFVKYCRVGVMNDIGTLLEPDVLVLLIGERPGLGRADSMSAYLAYRPKAGDTDADRDMICNIFERGGINPLEAGAFVIQLAQQMLQHRVSGVGRKSG
ncbi:MAG: ethanolamine ammonia-lyase subunit EutC [Desulfobacteraceae bacterium]|nr:ethanolamine ammonia-lyase subunit EutC [Desulfobacteraceae bacterium]